MTAVMRSIIAGRLRVGVLPRSFFRFQWIDGEVAADIECLVVLIAVLIC